jgi:hypothetical protein
MPEATDVKYLKRDTHIAWPFGTQANTEYI